MANCWEGPRNTKTTVAKPIYFMLLPRTVNVTKQSNSSYLEDISSVTGGAEKFKKQGSCWWQQIIVARVFGILNEVRLQKFKGRSIYGSKSGRLTQFLSFARRGNKIHRNCQLLTFNSQTAPRHKRLFKPEGWFLLVTLHLRMIFQASGYFATDLQTLLPFGGAFLCEFHGSFSQFWRLSVVTALWS